MIYVVISEFCASDDHDSVPYRSPMKAFVNYDDAVYFQAHQENDNREHNEKTKLWNAEMDVWMKENPHPPCTFAAADAQQEWGKQWRVKAEELKLKYFDSNSALPFLVPTKKDITFEIEKLELED